MLRSSSCCQRDGGGAGPGDGWRWQMMEARGKIETTVKRSGMCIQRTGKKRRKLCNAPISQISTQVLVISHRNSSCGRDGPCGTATSESVNQTAVSPAQWAQREIIHNTVDRTTAVAQVRCVVQASAFQYKESLILIT